MASTLEELDHSDSGMSSRDELFQDDPVLIRELPIRDEELGDLNFRNSGQYRSTNDTASTVSQKDDPDDYEYEEDESLAERLLGLTEMFPSEVRKCVYNIGSCLYSCTKGLYAYSCSATWLFFSSSTILIAPVLIELQRAQEEDAQRIQQKQVLLGPNIAMSNVNPQGLSAMPSPVQR